MRIRVYVTEMSHLARWWGKLERQGEEQRFSYSPGALPTGDIAFNDPAGAQKNPSTYAGLT
jgi:hypothetical protein